LLFPGLSGSTPVACIDDVSLARSNNNFSLVVFPSKSANETVEALLFADTSELIDQKNKTKGKEAQKIRKN
jgi:hypothetical protein